MGVRRLVCLVWDGDEASLDALLSGAGVAVIEGPVERVGGADGGTAVGVSRYVRDPDGNLVEFIVYESSRSNITLTRS